MTFNIHSFGRDYRRMLLFASVLSFLPLRLAYKLVEVAGRFRSPLRWQENTYRDGISASGLSLVDWDRLRQARISDHGAFCINIFRHETWDRRWFDHHVNMDKATLEGILASGKGCLFLTYHHSFQHTLCCLLGLAGFPVNALAAPEQTSVIYDQVARFIHRLHRGCATHFNGGDYLFFHTPKQAARMTNDALTAGSILISLNDFSLPTHIDEKRTCHLFGRAVLAPSGSVRLAQRMGTPIVTGITIREGTSYRVFLRQLDGELSTQEVMQSYFDFLAEILIDHPTIWDGWSWFKDLPNIKLIRGDNSL